MGDMAVARFGLVEVLRPLHHLPVTPGGNGRRHLSQFLRNFARQIALQTEILRTLDHDFKQIANRLDARRAAHRDHAAASVHGQVGVLRRRRRPRHQSPGLRVLDEQIGLKTSRGLENRPRAAAKEFQIPRVEPALPEMAGQPGQSVRPESKQQTMTRFGIAPDIGGVVGYGPAEAIEVAGHTGARFQKPFSECKERFMAFTQVGHFRGPVVHRDVDVQVIIGLPGWCKQMIPKPLQVGGQRTGLGGGHQEIPAVLEVKSSELGILAAGPDVVEAFIGGNGGPAGAAKIDLNAAELRLVGGAVLLVKIFK